MAYVPRESKTGELATVDGQLYQRDRHGVIRRVKPKVRGKAARKADKRARRSAFAEIRRVDAPVVDW